MTIKTILTEPNKILRQVSKQVEKVGEEEKKIMDEVKRLCNSVMMMKDGNIVDGGTPEDLIEKYGQKNLEEVFLQIVRKDK